MVKAVFYDTTYWQLEMGDMIQVGSGRGAVWTLRLMDEVVAYLYDVVFVLC